ncbi:MAG: hypothetical protein JF590_02900 [Gemmatimonadetes bacterium]|nr:hypothetical protein [Gemmatimonadota bacterium]
MSISARVLGALGLFTCAAAPLRLCAQGHPFPLVLGLPATARFAGLANAGVAVHGDAGALFVNPAGIATVRHAGIEATYHFSHSQPLEGSAAAAFRLKQFTFGGGAHYLKLDPKDPNADNLLTMGTVTYRYAIFAAGVSGKYVAVQDTAGKVSRAATGDVGVLVALFDLVAIGASFQNVGHKGISGGGLDLPHSSHLGAVFNFTDPQGTWVMRAIWEKVWLEGTPSHNKLAAELGFQLAGAFVTLRGGTGERNPATKQSDSAVGASLGFRRFAVDYAWQQRTALGGDVQRLGLRFTP